ncbi:hypothetical protein [Bacillus thuringiensis]|uniref:hypothetical protein n=1 Tax=Bacillus thuringiensis TaxID=1428 RepID=UPI000BEB3504|nr:hypothetical protein [Bacillus thuringiensis]PEE68584.1 hypothetical protein COM73_23525 [Bacillus thuringiensis]
MFDLLKDIDKYKGIPPYASEHYGVYQPLLGWESALTKKWVRRGGIMNDPNVQYVKRILDGRIDPAPQKVIVQNPDQPLDFDVDNPTVGNGILIFKVFLTKDLKSEVMKSIQKRVQLFVNGHNGRLPENEEWNQVIEINNLIELMQKVNDMYKNQIKQELEDNPNITDEILESAKRKYLELMQYESQIAAFLAFHTGVPGMYDPNELKKLFTVHEAPPLSDILKPTDPLASIDPTDNSGALSPIGFVHLFRQYFFDLGNFLGEPVEHVWLAPGTTMELIEVSTRKSILERSVETTLEGITRSEQSETIKDELSDAVKSENQNNTKLGMSTNHTVSYGVYQGTVSANLGLESTRKEAREMTHKQTREQSEKLSTEIKRSYKSVFKTVTETMDTRSRRYLLENKTNTMRNYELRRKMRRVGVQLQDLGNRLCWQVFIDDPGEKLGLSELVHFAESPDLASLKEPEQIPPPADISTKVIAPIPFHPILDYNNNRANYEYAYLETAQTLYKGKHLSRIKGDPDDDDSQTVMGPFSFKFDPPKSNYELKEVRVLGPQGSKIAIVRAVSVNLTANKFDIIMERVNFGGENVINLEVELVYRPLPEAFNDYEAVKKKAQDQYNMEKDQLLKKSFKDSVRQRIKDANNINERPSWDLREEERTIIYRKLIERLMLDSWKLPDTDENRRLSHVRSEIIRSIFDVDAMLYFVAPEWWIPHRRRGQVNLDVKVTDQSFSLTEDDIVKWGGEKRPDNYKITEDSNPAKLGSSLGWLLQLDGDNLRNAFLNAPWVKAVIPIRPGREKAALNWLKNIEGHENDGWDTPYMGNDDPELQGKTIGQVLEIITDRLEKQNNNIQDVLEADKVFQKGFDHLAGGFDAGLPKNQIFSQWITVLPTDQIVGVEFTPTNLND